jgi:hypothetical protein
VTYTRDDFDERMRVMFAPHTDAWMRGDRYGTVVLVGRRLIHVHMDRSQRVLRVPASYIQAIL